MHVQYIRNRDHPSKKADARRRLHRLGITGNIIYICMDFQTCHKFYAVDVRFPTNWHVVGEMEGGDLSYIIPTVSPDGRFIFVVFLRATDFAVHFAVKKFDLREKTETVYIMPIEEVDRVFEIPFDHIKVKCGHDYQLVFYDRTIIEGEIPFWTTRFNEEDKSFTVLKNSIRANGDDSDERSTLFPIAINAVNRCFAKLMGPRKMLVYTEERKKWVEYVLPPEVSLVDIFGTDGFPIEDNKSVRETYGTHGRRVGAMQTKLTFHDQDGWVVARVLHNDHLHTTAIVEFVHGKREVHVRKLASFNVDELVSKMFYIITSPDYHVFLGIYATAIVFIKSPTLEQMSGWKLQTMLERDGFEVEMAQVTNFQQLIALAIAKYTEKDEAVKEHLKVLGIREAEPELVENDFELD